MRWVNETFPPRPRWSALLMTVRLSMRSLAGTARTLVAVGTARLASMLTTTRAAGPLSRSTGSSPVWAGGALGTGVAPGAGISVVRVGVPAEDAGAGGEVG